MLRYFRQLALLLLFLGWAYPVEAATVTHGVTLNSATNGASWTTASFTPAAGDTLIFFANVGGTGSLIPPVSDSLSGAWSQIEHAERATSMAYAYIRTTQVNGSAMTVTLGDLDDPGTSCIGFVVRISGLIRTGALAIRQSAKMETQTAATGLNVSLGSNGPSGSGVGAPLKTDILLGFMVNAVTSPATADVAPLSDGQVTYTEHADEGVESQGAEYVSLASGWDTTSYILTAVVWGSNSATQWAAIAVEINTSPLGSYSWLMLGVGL